MNKITVPISQAFHPEKEVTVVSVIKTVRKKQSIAKEITCPHCLWIMKTRSFRQIITCSGCGRRIINTSLSSEVK